MKLAAVDMSPAAERALAALNCEEQRAWIYGAVQNHYKTLDGASQADRVYSVHETGAGPGKVLWIWSGPETGHVALRLRTPEEYFYRGNEWRN